MFIDMTGKGIPPSAGIAEPEAAGDYLCSGVERISWERSVEKCRVELRRHVPGPCVNMWMDFGILRVNIFSLLLRSLCVRFFSKGEQT